MTSQIPIILIDTNTDSLEVLKAYLKDTKFQVIGEYTDIIQGYNAILEERPSIVILDISEKKELALDILNKITLNHKACKTIVTSSEYSTDRKSTRLNSSHQIIS